MDNCKNQLSIFYFLILLFLQCYYSAKNRIINHNQQFISKNVLPQTLLSAHRTSIVY